MIIFMEYCSHGTIEEAARQGLTEDMIRRYTKDILVSIDVLHEHHIVHRDIKGLYFTFVTMVHLICFCYSVLLVILYFILHHASIKLN